MKISNKEKIMLSILAIVLVGIIYYNFVFLKQTLKIADKTKEKNAVEEKYNTTMNTINSLEKRNSDIKILNTKVNDKSVKFYPSISQEHLILEIDKLLKDNGLEGGLNFQPIVVQEVESMAKSQENLKESSIQSIVDRYDSIYGKDNKTLNNFNESEEKNSQNKDKNEVSNYTSKKSTEESTSSKSSDSKDSNKKTVEQLKFELNFSGSYTALNDFLKALRNYQRKIIVSSISISQKTLGDINGTMCLEIYAIPKLDEDLDEYLKWNLENTYGKNSPFNTDGSVGNSIISENTATSDFMISAKSTTSVLPTVMIGKSNDSSRNTYVYSDSNKQEEVEIVLTKDGDKYYYKYKTTNGSYPHQYEGLGTEFLPISENIIINILSESRVTSNDKSGVKIKLINKTDKLVNVEINSDDSEDPRVVIDGDGKNISVSNK